MERLSDCPRFKPRMVVRTHRTMNGQKLAVKLKLTKSSHQKCKNSAFLTVCELTHKSCVKFRTMALCDHNFWTGGVATTWRSMRTVLCASNHCCVVVSVKILMLEGVAGRTL